MADNTIKLDRIEFKNLPSGNTPVNDENLNTVQDNVEKFGNVISKDAASKLSTEQQRAEKKEKELEDTIKAQVEELNDLKQKHEKIMKDYDTEEVSGTSIHINDSLEYDMPISINGGIEQDTREGYNQLNTGAFVSETKNGITATLNNDKSITLSGTATSATAFAYYFDTLKLSGTHLFKTIISGTITGNITHNLRNGTTMVTTDQVLESNSTKTQTLNLTEQDITNGFFYISSGATLNCTIYPMLIAGNDTTKPYEQYGQMPSLDFPSEVKGVSGHYDTVVENKQLFKKYTDTGSLTVNGVEITNNADGSFTLNGTCTQNSWVEVVTAFQNGTVEQKTPKYLLNGEETYTFSLNKISGSVSNSAISAFLQANTSGSFGVSETKNQIQVKGNGVYRSWIYLAKDVVFNNYNFALQLEIGDTKTDYTPHQEQLLPIDIPFNMYSGKAYKENGKWYRKVEWFEKVFNGTETFIASSYSNEEYLCAFNSFASENYDIKQNSKTTYCNCLPLGVYINTSTKECIGNHEKTLNLKILVSRLSENSIAGLQAFLKELYDNGKPMKVLCQLAEPYTEEITDTTLIAQLEELEKAKSYYEVTNINSYGSEDAAPLVLSGEYVRSNKIRIENLEKAILSLGGNV